MLVTYEIPRTTIADIQEKLHQVDGVNVWLSDEVHPDDDLFEAILEIDFNSCRYQLPILKPSDSDDPSQFECWLFSGFGFNPLMPIAWFRWLAFERKQLRDLEDLLEATIGLSRRLD